MKLEQGDLFEQAIAGWIREHLPTYEKVWQEFIGHDGNGRPLSLGLTPDKEKSRVEFYQAHYSFAQSAYQLYRKVDEENNDVKPIINTDDFWLHSERLALFIMYLGNIRDMFAKMDAALSAKGKLCADFQEFYDQRSHVIHGPRMPVQFDDTSWKIPAIATRNPKEGEWTDKTDWNSVDSRNTVYVADYMRRTRNDVFNLMRNKHQALYSIAKSYFGKDAIVQVNPQMQPLSGHTGIISPGFLQSKALSGSML